jgi:hypothetical protein
MSYYNSDRGNLLGRAKDIRHMLDEITRLLVDLPDEAALYHQDRARLVAWASMDMAWREVYHAWSIIKAEEVDNRQLEAE